MTYIKISYVNNVIATFERHKTRNGQCVLTHKQISGKHENLNGRIQSILTKEKSFLNSDRY